MQGMQKMTEIFNIITDKELAEYAVLNKKLIDFISKK
jgi:hypothetical protein